MKTLMASLIFVAVALGTAQAGDITSTQRAGAFEVSLGLGGDALVLGPNTATVALRDADGKHLSGLPVELYYFMPSMPAMNTTVKATPEGNLYTGSIEPSMGGVWEVEVRFRDPDGENRKATFSFDVK